MFFSNRASPDLPPPVFFCRPPLASLTVDLYPLALHVSLCDASGRPGGRERLVLTSHHVHVRDMLVEALDSSRQHGFSRGLSMGAIPNTQEASVVYLALYGNSNLHTAVVLCGRIMCVVV